MMNNMRETPSREERMMEERSRNENMWDGRMMEDRFRRYSGNPSRMNDGRVYDLDDDVVCSCWRRR